MQLLLIFQLIFGTNQIWMHQNTNVLNYSAKGTIETMGNIDSNHNSDQFEEYVRVRQDLITSGIDSSFGNDISLNEKELCADEIIMAAKEKELDIGLDDPHRFNPARHIFDALGDIKQSKLFKIIEKMPKGGILHTHDMSMCSADYAVSLTYLPFLWQRTSNKDRKIQEFRFSRNQPTMNISDTNSSEWHLVSTVREKNGQGNL